MSTEQIVSQPPAAAAAGAPAASAPAEGSPLATAYRSTLAGALRAADVGTQVTLGGWVHRSRNLGGILFLDLRDRAGLVQVSFGPQHTSAAVIEAAAAVGVESVVTISGRVVARPADQRNPEMATGDVEVQADGITVV